VKPSMIEAADRWSSSVRTAAIRGVTISHFRWRRPRLRAEQRQALARTTFRCMSRADLDRVTEGAAAVTAALIVM